MRWITVATLVVVGFIALVGLARFLLPAEQPHDGSSAVLAPGQSPSIYREDAHVICKSKGVEQIASEHEVAPGPEAAARAYAREYYAGESYGDCRQKAAYEGCLAGLTNR